MTNAVSVAQYGTINPAWRNRIINGDMRINQRAVTSVASGAETYTLDRWIVGNYFLSGAISVAQSTDAPAGFTNSLQVTNGTGESLVASDYGVIRQKIEGFNVSDLAWGTASAAPITISFWVKSSVTGNYSFGLINNALNRANRTVFTINAANTWEQKTVQFSGDTTGTWVTNNGIGLYVDVILVAGSNQYAAANTWTSNALEGVSGASANWVTSTNATFFITGVQLEAGTNATPFEQRDYGRELAMCQRYFISYGGQSVYEPFGVGVMTSATNGSIQLGLPVPMRTAPSTFTAIAPTSFLLVDGVSAAVTTSLALDATGNQQVMFNAVVSGGLAGGRGCRLFSNNNTNTRIQFSSEL